MRHKTAGNIATFALSIPLIPSRLRAGRRGMRLALAAALLLLGAASPLAAEGSTRVADTKNLGGRGPLDMAVVKRGDRTYVEMINLDNKQIVTYRLEAGNALTEVGRTPTCDEARSLAVTPNNRWLLVACSSQNSVWVYEIVADPSQGSAVLTKRSTHTLGLGDKLDTGEEPSVVKACGNGFIAISETKAKVRKIELDRRTGKPFVPTEIDPPDLGLAPESRPASASCILKFSNTQIVVTSRGPVTDPATRSSDPTLASAARASSDDIALVVVGNFASNDLTLLRMDREGKLHLVTRSIPVGGSPRALASDPSGRRLFVAVRSTPPAEDQIRAYKVGPGGELTLAGSTPGGRFLTDIEVTSDRVYVVTVNNQNRDEIRTYRRRGMELILDTALVTPGQPASFKQITTTPGQGNLTNVFMTEYQGGFLRSIEYTRDNQVACAPDSENLCLNGVEVQVDFLASGNLGFGQAARLTDDTGSFTFFNRENIELVPKVLDGRAINNSFWVFYGALSNVAYRLRFTETRTGRVNEYDNKAGNLGSFADTNAFPAASIGLGAEASAGAASAGEIAELAERTQEELYALLSAGKPAQAPLQVAACAPGGTKLCLNQNRFEVRVDWSVPSTGQSGSGVAVPVTGDTGYFTFFDAANVELIIKVLDARVFSGKFWLFYGALSNVEYTITVTDTETGQVKTYFNPSGTLASVADTSAF